MGGLGFRVFKRLWLGFQCAPSGSYQASSFWYLAELYVEDANHAA